MLRNFNRGIIPKRFEYSMLLSTLSKMAGMIISLLYTPIILNYLGEESYGIWSTILSIVNWINFFDIGIGNGLRNQLAKDVSHKDKKEACSSITTAYLSLSVISSSVLIIGSFLIYNLNCYTLFNTKINVKPALFISFIFICINFVLSLSKIQLYATHQAEYVGLMTVVNQLLNVFGLFILSKLISGSVTAVAIVVGATGIFVNVIFTGHIWNTHEEFIPRWNHFKKEKLSSIGGLGLKFFVIQIAAMILYTTDNLIITQLFGPMTVTPYHTVYTAFGLVNGLFSAMMSPLWSRYTVAMESQEFLWIKQMIRKLDLALIPITLLLLTAVVCFKPISEAWLHKTLYYENGLILSMAIYYILYIWGSIYSTALNGMGKVNFQMVLSIISAIINIPLSIFFGKYMGLQSTGVLFATIICMLIVDIPVTHYVHRYLKTMINQLQIEN